LVGSAESSIIEQTFEYRKNPEPAGGGRSRSGGHGRHGRHGGLIEAPRCRGAPHSSSPARRTSPIDGHREIALTTIRTTVFLILAALLILVLLPMAVAAQAAAE
jgi:hypothetical protein